MSALGFVIEDRAGVRVLVYDSGGCRPASTAEAMLWDEIRRIGDKARALHTELQQVLTEIKPVAPCRAEMHISAVPTYCTLPKGHEGRHSARRPEAKALREIDDHEGRPGAAGVGA